MKLQDRFDHIGKQTLSENEKQEIYKSILDATHRAIFIKKMRFYAKVGVYTATTIGAIFLFVASYTPQVGPSYVLTGKNDALTTMKKQANNTVLAETVGKLIKIDGTISVFKGDKKIETGDLQTGDIVLLESNARVEVTVRDGVKATIIGPAKFTIERMDDEGGNPTYIFNLLEGLYAEIITIAKKKTVSTDNVEQSLPVEAVIVKTKHIEIQQTPSRKNLHVTISSDEEGTPVITNQGDAIILKQIAGNDENEFSVVNSDEVVKITDDQLVFTTIDEVASQVDELGNKQFAIRYELDNPLNVSSGLKDANNDVDDNEDNTRLPFDEIIVGDTASQEGNVDSNIDILDQEVSQPKGENRVLKETQMDEIAYAMNPVFLTKHLQDINQAHIMEDDAMGSIAKENLAGLVNRARQVVGLSGVGSSYDSLSSGLSELVSVLSSNYFVPPSLTEPLTKANNWIAVIAGLPTVSDLKADGIIEGGEGYNEILELMKSKGIVVVNSL